MISREEIISFSRKALGLKQSVGINVAALSGRGSDRAFYRLTWGKADSAILIHYDQIRVENAYYADIAVFLNGINVPAPRLIHHSAKQHIMLMEDLGDTDLWAMRNEPWEIRRNLYQGALAMVHRLHSFPADEFPSTGVRLMEPFTLDLYKWERNYFRDNFVQGVCGIDLESTSGDALEKELNLLAVSLQASGRSLVHRDLQSQNVMVRNGVPCLIDFQGMRFGSPFYDLGSLLCDPYVTFAEKEREELLFFYYSLSKKGMTWTAFMEFFWKASVQRLMQALGAYGFLGLKKGLNAFLGHIPAGLANLQCAASHVSCLSCLREVLEECRVMIEAR